MKYVWLRRLVRLEIVFIFLVILAGSVVRMTGSGMGCPDWPKCFGYIVPPTEEEQVLWMPGKTYQEGQMIVHEDAMYSANGDFTTGDVYVPANWTKYTVHDYAIFNPTHTWVEYINRLFGVLSGIPMALLFFITLFNVRRKPLHFVLSAIGLFLLGFEAWLGKEVVDGHLIPGQITFHMLGAFAIVVAMVVFLKRLVDQERVELPFSRWAVFGVLVLLLIQTVLGTQVREQVDLLTKQYGDTASRAGWVDKIDTVIYIHRSASLLVGLLIGYLWWKVRKAGVKAPFIQLSGILVILAITSGAFLFYFDLPRFLQPVHLLLSAGMIGALTWGWVRFPKSN